jgi:hypothetical protein
MAGAWLPGLMLKAGFADMKASQVRFGTVIER